MKSIAIVGDSISSLGALQFFFENQKLNFILFHITDKRKIEIKYKKIPEFNRYLGKEGTSNFWHAVSPIDQKANSSYKDLFKLLYGFYPEVTAPQLFTPYIRPNSANVINFFRKEFGKKSSNKLIHKNGTVEKIKIIENNKKRIFFVNGKTLDVDFLILAINPLDILDLIGLDKNEVTLYDHIHTCHGIINSSVNSTMLSKKSYKNIHGYFYNYEKSEKFIVYLKPFYGEPNKIQKQLNFGKKRSEIYRDILLSTDLTPKFTALSAKFGIRFPTKYYAIWSQQVVKREFDFDEKLNLYVPTEKFKRINEVFHPDMKLIMSKSNAIIPGNHLYMVVNKCADNFLNESNIFCSAIKPNLDFFDGRHSSLLLSNYLYHELDQKLKPLIKK